MAEVGRPGGALVTSAREAAHPRARRGGTCAVMRVRFLTGAGIDLVIGRRRGYHIWDVDGRGIDIHLNGGVLQPGASQPGCDRFAVHGAGNPRHRQPSFPQHGTCRASRTPDRRHARCPLRGLCQWRREAIDAAIKSARRATGRRRVVSVVDAYHGQQGLALAAGDEQAANAFLRQNPISCGSRSTTSMPSTRPWPNPLPPVILETVPATAGFPDRIRSICQPCASSATRPAPCTSPTRSRPASAAAGTCGRWTTRRRAGHPGHW